MILQRLVLVGALGILVTGCATATHAPEPDGAGRTRVTPAPGPDGTGRSRVTPAPPSGPAVQTGRASWYGEAHHGKKTASGETYDKTRLTAAHRTLPLGTRVRVTNIDNGRSVVVRINDRGPFMDGRVIDLSEAAAREIGALGPGLMRVRLEVLEDAAVETPAPAGPR